jgi:hypothetical protein
VARRSQLTDVSGRASKLGAGAGGKAVLPRARRSDRAAEALGQRPTRPHRQDRRRGARPRAGFRRQPSFGRRLRVLWQRDAPAPPEVPDGLVQVLVALVGEQVALSVSGPPPTAEAASAVRARDLLARTSVRDGMSFRAAAPGGRHHTDAVNGHGCIGAADRSWREPGDAARRPPAPLSATPGLGERFIGRGRRAEPRRAGLRTFCETAGGPAPVAGSTRSRRQLAAYSP